MSDFKPGEIVDITIKGARVVVLDDPELSVEYGKEGFALDLVSDEVTVERVAPAEWPPRPGDLWREVEGGGLWFVFRDPSVMHPSPSGMRAKEAGGERWTDDPLRLIDNGPLTLVHREDEQDGARDE